MQGWVGDGDARRNIYVNASIITSLEHRRIDYESCILCIIKYSPKYCSYYCWFIIRQTLSLRDMRRIQSQDVRFIPQHPELTPQIYSQTKQHRFLREAFQIVYLPHDSPQTFIQKIKQHRAYLQSTNHHAYPYSRAHHYHFFLDQFPRIPGQPTYALDLNNKFMATFSQQQKLYKGQRLGSIVNRVAFTLPRRWQYVGMFAEKKRGNTHNRAHDQLFSIQSSKSNLDRELLTCRLILKNLQRLTQNYQLWQFDLLKQHNYAFLRDETLSVEEKRTMLQNQITSLQLKRSNLVPVWQANDQMFFYSSLQQKLHDRIQYQSNLEVVQVGSRIQHYLSRHTRMVESLSKEDTDLSHTLTKLFCFVNSKLAAVSATQLEILKAHLNKINKPLKTALPMLIFAYGSSQLRDKVNRIVVRFIENKEISMDQECRATLTRLFVATFAHNQEEEIGSYQAKVMAKTVTNRLKRQMDVQRDRAVEPILLDEYVNQTVLNESTSDRQQCLPIFNISTYKIAICEQQMQMLFYYNNICRAVSLFEPLIHEDERVMKVLCSPYLDHLLHGIIGHIPNKSIGQLINNLRHLVEHAILSNCIQEKQVYTDFYWQFNEQNGVGIVWSEPKKPAQGKDLSHFYSILAKQNKQQAQQEPNKQRQQQQRQQQEERQEMGDVLRKKVKQEYEQAC